MLDEEENNEERKMLNWWGNRKIGIVGMDHSGKTMFITSMLCHLAKHDPSKFSLGPNGKAQIKNFQIIVRKDHDFNFEKHRNTLIQQNRWPAKTLDYSIAECRYEQDGRFCDRHLKIVDIPGERLADIKIWQAKNYHAWVESLWQFWENDPNIKKYMSKYMDSARNPDSSLVDLGKEYKTAIWDLMEHYCPITPSTYFLNVDGSMIREKNEEVKKEMIENRHIWNKKDLLPLPKSWFEDHTAEYKEQKKLFYDYKKKVLKPLFREIDDCDHFILCVNIPGILDRGPERMLYEQWLFENFMDELKPSKFIRFRDRCLRNPPRLAFVATQSDRDSSKNHNNLKYLLEQFVLGTKIISGVKAEYFTCSACNSFEDNQNGDYIGHNLRNNDEIKKSNCPAIPSAWPNDKDGWDKAQQNFPELVPIIKDRKPRQDGLNIIYEFIVG